MRETGFSIPNAIYQKMPPRLSARADNELFISSKSRGVQKTRNPARRVSGGVKHVVRTGAGLLFVKNQISVRGSGW